MAAYPVSVDVSDFVANGAAPSLAYATIGRARINATSGEIITEAPISIRLTATPQTIQLEQNVAYKIHLFGVAGFTTAFYAAYNQATTLADLYASHQVDPATLNPAPVPPTTQQLLDQANTVLQQVLAVGFTVAVDPVDSDALMVGYPTQMVDPADADAILFTTGA